MSQDRVLSEIRGRLAAHDGLLVVGVSGIECSGKSTFAENLAHSLNEDGVSTHVVCIDRFLNPAPLRHQGDTLADAYYANTFRFEDLTNQIIEPARRAGRICGDITVIDLENETLKTQAVDTPGLDVLIIEGVFLFRDPLIGHFDLKIWVDIGFDAALKRAVRRPQEVDHYPNRTAITERYRARYFPAQRRHIKNDHPNERADLVVEAE